MASSSSPARKVSVEQLWNCYALEDEDQRKKLWLDVFLCRAIKGDPFLSGQVSRTRILPHLIAELKNEIGLFCRPSLAADDLEQLKRYVYAGRGWKIILVLNTILSNASTDLPFLRDEDGKEFVDLLISLYQLSVFPHSSNGKSRTNPSADEDQKESISAMDLWHETLMTAASVEQGKQHEAKLEVLIENTHGLFWPVVELWEHLFVVTNRKEKGPFPNVMTKRQKKRAEKTLLRGFSTSSKSNFQVSNLFSYERRFSSCSKISSDSDSAEVEDLLQRNQYVYLPPPLSNPLDYEFFVNVIRSEDEAVKSTKWQKMKSKLTSSPVTPSLRLEDMVSQAQDTQEMSKSEVDLQMYLAPDHMEVMFARLSACQLSHLVAKLMTTICTVEIRWKLRQKKSQLPMTSNTLLYTMSYPLAQFASDTLTSTKNSPSNINLRLNLVALLLTGLSDVVLFGDLQLCFSELFQHHKILHKCLEVVQNALGHIQVKNEVKISTLVCLWRTFRVILEKHANPKAVKTTRELYRLKKEELVKSSCIWFSADSGLASVTLSFLANKMSTIEDQCDLNRAAALFAEIGRIVKAVGLCTLGSQDTSSYGYLKETRVALSLIFNEATKLFLYFSQQCNVQHVITDAIAKCLFNSICVNTFNACNCALVFPERSHAHGSVSQDDLFKWLEAVWSHRYGKHHIFHQVGSQSGNVPLPQFDSDSAFCASDSSSVIEVDDLETVKKNYNPLEKSTEPWQLYLEACTLPKFNGDERLKKHLNRVTRILDKFGKQDMLIKLILPLLEHSLPNRNGVTIWAMKSIEHLLPLCRLDVNLYKKKFRLIYPKLISLCLNDFNCETGFSAMQCLKLMAYTELTRRGGGNARCSIEDTIPTSDEDGSVDSEEVFVNEMLNGALIIPELQNHFSAKNIIQVTDLPLLIIQRQLIEANEVYGRHLIRSNFHRALRDMAIHDIKMEKELLVVVLQILSLLISLNAEEKLVNCRNALFDRITSHGHGLSNGSTRVPYIMSDIISVLLASDRTEEFLVEDGALNLLPQTSDINYDADCESDVKMYQKQSGSSLKLISNAGLTRVISLIHDWSLKKDQDSHCLESALWRIHEYIRKLQPIISLSSNMNLTSTILKTIKGQRNSWPVIQAAMSVCDAAFQQGEIINSVFMSEFIKVVESTTQADILERLMMSMNMLIKGQWKASTSPLGWISFPRLIDDDPVAKGYPWIEWEISLKERKIREDIIFGQNGFTMSLWLSVLTVSSKPLHIASLGTAGLRTGIQVYLLNDKQICIQVVSGNNVAGSATYDLDKNLRKGEWFNLVVIVKMTNQDVDLTVKTNLKTLVPKTDGSMKLPRSGNENDTISLQLGSTDRHNASKYKYSHLWVFRKSLSAKEACLLYCLGPSVTILEPLMFQGKPLPIVRTPLLKRALLQNSKETADQSLINSFLHSTSILEELRHIRLSLCLSHGVAGHDGGSILHVFPSNSIMHPSRSGSLFQSLFQSSHSKVQSNVPEPQETIEATKINGSLKVHDNYADSWCDALEKNGGMSLLLLMLFHVTEHQAGDTSMALILDSILSTLEDGCVTLLMQEDAADVLKIIKKVLYACQDQVGPKTLQVFLEHSITQPPDHDQESKLSCQGVIFNGQYLSFVLENWKLWSSCQEAIFTSFLTLVQDVHANRDINVQCLRQLNLIQTLTREMMKLQQQQQQPSSSALTSIIELFSALVGSPPDLHVVNSLVQAALLLHESTYTYIHHAKNTFYFAIQELTPKPFSSSLTWPRATTNRSSLPKSASFCNELSHATKLTQAFEQTKSFDSNDGMDDNDDDSQDNATKLNPERLRKVLRRTKRSGAPPSSLSKRCVSMASPEASSHEIHFGHLSRFEDLGLHSHEKFAQYQFEEECLEDEPMEEQPPHTLIEGILDILNGALLNMPDNSAAKATSSVILPEFILVFANHPDPHTRLSALRLLVKHVQRTESITHRNANFKLHQIKGFHLLSCQLTSWDCKTVSPLVMDKTASSILSLLHGSDVFSTSTIPELPTRGAKILMYALPALLALLPPLAASGNIHLATTHSLIVHLHDITTRVQNFIKEGQEKFGLFEALCRTLESLVTSPKTYWDSDIYGKDGRDILFEDLDNLFRFIGMQLATAAGSSNFNSLVDFTNLLTSMIWTYETENVEHQKIGAVFRRYLLSIQNQGISEVMERLRRQDQGVGVVSTFKNAHGGFGTGLMLSNGDAGLAAGEEVAELLMKSIVDDKRMQELNNQRKRTRRRRATSYSSDDSFSFRADALRSHSNYPSEAIKAASRSELLSRLDQLVTQVTENCIHACILHSPHGNMQTKPTEFLVSFMSFLMNQLQLPSPNYFLSLDGCKNKLILLAIASLHPTAMDLEDRVFVQMQLSSRNDDWSKRFHQLVVQNSSPNHVSLYQKLVAKLAHDCNHHFEDEKLLHSEDEEKDDSLKSSSSDEVAVMLEKIQHLPVAFLDEDEMNSLSRICDEEFKNVTKNIAAKVEKKTFQMRRDHAGIIADVTAKAIEATGVAMAAQDVLRKDHLMNLTDQMAQDMHTRQVIARIVDNCHERGPWPSSQRNSQCDNSSWKLDEIEGHQRMRLRLRRSTKNLDKKFYLNSSSVEENDHQAISPFGHLLKASDVGGVRPGWASVMIKQFGQKNQSPIVKVMESCLLVIPSGEVVGECLLTEEAVHFVQGQIDPNWNFSFSLDRIQEVWPRRYQLNDCAIELFFEGGVTRLLSFNDQNKRDIVHAHFLQMNPQLNLSSPEWQIKRLNQLTQQWQDGKMTNFDYLMALNKFAGRTFNDLMQYPIFPFVLADYSSAVLDLNSIKSFRDLRKPISVQHSDKEEIYRNKYRILAEELKVSHENTCPGVGPYHYGSHYSNAGIVLHFLVRLPPFTAMFLKYQDGNFDLPDRTFHDMSATWALATTDTTTDVKELIPELFYMPELLVNLDSLNFGEKQNGERVDDVVLPPWANDDPRLFIKIHRQALEADYVRENLHHWVDLIFGYKQIGTPAVEAINIFHPSTYYGFDLNTIKDPVQRQARATMIKTYGQTPKQLFSRPHPMPFIRLTATEKIASLPLTTTANVMGLKWGHIVGISSSSTQVFGDFATRVSLMPLSRDRMLGAPFGAISLFLHTKGSQSSKTSAGVEQLPSGACVISPDPSTGWLVAYLKKGARPRYLLPVRSSFYSDTVSCMHSIPDEKVFWIGHESGKVTAVSYCLHTAALQLSLEKIQSLYGHKGRINDIAASRQWSLVATASADGSTILWDTRKMTYVRSICWAGTDDDDNQESSCSHQLVKISPTCGDLAIVTSQSDLLLYSLNDRFIGVQKRVQPAITSLAFSQASEGNSINVVSTGHCQTGVIKLWSTWDLSPLRDLATNHVVSPITSLAFSMDSKYLYASFADHFLAIFQNERESSPVSRPPNYLDLSRIMQDT